MGPGRRGNSDRAGDEAAPRTLKRGERGRHRRNRAGLEIAEAQVGPHGVTPRRKPSEEANYEAKERTRQEQRP